MIINSNAQQWLFLFWCMISFPFTSAMEEQKKTKLPFELFKIIQWNTQKQNRYDLRFNERKFCFSRNNLWVDCFDKTSKSGMERIPYYLKYVYGFAQLTDVSFQTSFIFYDNTEQETVSLEFFASNEGKAFFDGPNDKKLIVLGQNNVFYDVQMNGLDKKKLSERFSKSEFYLLERKKKEECSGLSEYRDRFLDRFAFCSNEKKTGCINALALHKTENYIAIVSHAYLDSAPGFVQKIQLFDAANVSSPETVIDGTISSECGLLKKICFLKPRTLLGLTCEGALMRLVVHKDGSITTHREIIKDSKEELKLKDMAVDPCNTGQMVMLLEDNRLMYGDLNKLTFSLVCDNFLANELWYYNDVVGYITESANVPGSSKYNKCFVTMPLYQFSNEKLVGFCQNYLEEQKKNKSSESSGS